MIDIEGLRASLYHFPRHALVLLQAAPKVDPGTRRPKFGRGGRRQRKERRSRGLQP